MSASGSSSRDHGKIQSAVDYLSWKRLHLAKAKLSNVAEMASFMAGFAVVATVELQINDDANPYLLTAFTISTALLVGTSMLAIMISTCVLPHVASIAKMELVAQVKQSPHDRMAHLIDLSWVMSHTASMFFFTLDVILLCWIKFTYFSPTASIAATAIMGPVLIIILVFAVIFYRKIAKHEYIIRALKFQELEELKERFDRDDEMARELSRSDICSLGGGNGNLTWGRVQFLKEHCDDSRRGSLRSRASSESEGSFSKMSRSRGSIFIV